MKLLALPPLWRPFSGGHLSLSELAFRAVRWACAIVCLAALLAGIYFLGERVDHFIRQSPYFVISDIDIRGASDPLKREVRAAIDSRIKDGDSNLLLFRADHAQFWVESLPRVGRATVAKKYPRTLRIDVEERAPLAGVSGGGLYWVDKDGVLLASASPGELADSKAPILTGVRAPRFAPGVRLDQPRLAQTLQAIDYLRRADPSLARRLVEWHISPQNEVVGILDAGVEVRFGEDDPVRRLPVLAAALGKIGDLDRRTYLDLRFDSQVVYF